MHAKFCGFIVALLVLAGLGATSAEAARKRSAHVERPQWSDSNPFSLFAEPTERASRGTRAASTKAHRTRATRQESRSRASSDDMSLSLFSERPQRSSHALGPRPSQWCGWWMRTQLGGGPEYNLASNWRRYGSPSSPHVGAVVVWPHHVGIITGQTASGQWIVKSGNYGGRVAEVPRSIAGAAIRS